MEDGNEDGNIMEAADEESKVKDSSIKVSTEKHVKYAEGTRKEGA